MDMAASPVVLLLLLQTVAPLKLFAPQTHRASLGKNVQIPCSFIVDKPPVDRSLLKIIWYFQGKQVLTVDDKSEDPTDPRLSYLDRAWDGRADLYISNTSLSDGGLYKCSVIYSNQRKEAEIRLDIQAPPQVTITDKTVVVNAESVLRCSVTGFYPVDIDIKWFRGSERLSDVTVDQPQRNQDGLYSVNSTVYIIPTEEDRKQNFSCRVHHESLLEPHQETFQLVYGAVPSIHILPHTFIKNVEQPLVCLVSGFYPESIVVNWLLNGTNMEKTEIKRINSSAVEAMLHFLPTEEIWGTEVSCVVEHDTLLRPQPKSLTVLGKDLTRNYFLGIAAAILFAFLGAGTILFYVSRYRKKRHPKLRNITPSADGSFSLNVDHFYPDNIFISWEIFQPPSSKNPQTLQSTDLMEENQDGTFNVISTTESLRGKVDESEKYSLRAAVTHKKLKHPSYREWSNENKDNTRFLSPPELGEILAPSLMVSSPAQLQCTISRFYPDDLTVKWIKKVKDNEETIETREKYKMTLHRSQQQRDKTFTCTAGLTLTPSLEDQGSEIICRVTHPGLERPAERSTGQLEVRVKPTCDRPIQLSITDSGDVTADLSLLNFYPKDIMIKWSYGRSQEKKPSEEKANGNLDGTFSIITNCNIPEEIFNQRDCKIKVTWKHETMDKAESREMGVGHEDYPWRPRIMDLTPLILQLREQTTVTCKISEFFPNNLTVTWYKKTGDSVTQCASYPYKVSSTPERSADNSYSCSASLSFTATSQPEDLEFICKVSHPSLKDPIERSTGKAMRRVIPQMEKPVTFTLSEAGRVRCRTRFIKFYPSDIKITWTYGGDKPIPSTRKLIQTDGEQTFDATSECAVPWDYFMSGVRVTWEHESLTSPQHQDLCVKDFPWRPVIEEIDKPVFLVNTKATLQCKISQYFPNNLAVTWYKKKKGNLEQTWNMAPLEDRQPDNTFSWTTSLTVTPSIRDDGAEFICRAQHPSLEQHIEQTTGPIQVYASPTMQGPIQCSIEGRDVLCKLNLQNFYPKSIEIKWSCSSNRYIKSRETYSYESNAVSTFNVSSECRVAQQIIDDPNFRIMVTWSHESLREPEKREAYIRDAGLPWRPTVSEIFTPTMRLNEEVKLHCGISRHFLQNLSVSWVVKERGGHNYTPVDRSTYHYKITEDQFSDTGYRSTLHFHPSLSRHHGVWFMCRVTHPNLDAPIERSAGPLLITLSPELRKELIITPYGTDAVLCSVKIKKFFPKKITVTWIKEESCVMASKTILQVNEEEEEAFDAITECTIPRTQLRFPLRVTWGHESMENPQSLQLKDTDFSWQPVIEKIDQPDFFVNREATLQCKISQYFPNNLTVAWYKKKKGNLDEMEKTTPTAERQRDNTYSCTASLTVTPSIEDDGAEFICRAQHPSLERRIEQTTGPIQVYVTPKRREGPIITPYGTDAVLCSVKIRKFFPKKIKVYWINRESCVMSSKTILQVNEEEEEVYDAISECTIPWTQLRFPMRVTWEHESMENPQSFQLKDTEFLWHPILQDIELPVLTDKSEAELQCRITGYFPDAVTVSWYKKKKGQVKSLHDNNKYKTSVTKSERLHDSTFSCTARLRFTPTLKKQESEIICRVEHPSLERPLERSTGPLHVEKNSSLRNCTQETSD
ncbi:uncharacterized protein [Phyllobates terribilis]|uniref:uncharacterized protein n=1 Tax=Phyllobates terribilis TaxID=111132 RepID=UPI003CCACBA1